LVPSLRYQHLNLFASSQEEASRIDRLAEEIGTIQSLRHSFQPILTIILMALDAPVIFMRTKALKALGQIIAIDASILATVNITAQP
jgi:cohesin loading factor subunit SCC2